MEVILLLELLIWIAILLKMYQIRCQIKMCNQELCRHKRFYYCWWCCVWWYKIQCCSDLVRSLGCNDLSAGKKFTLLLGTDTNMLTYTIPNSGLPVAVKIKTDVGFGILINEQPICVFSRNEILCSRPIDMEQHSIKNVKNSVERFHAVNKAYVDRVKYKSFTGIIPNTFWQTTHSSHFPMRKVF